MTGGGGAGAGDPDEQRPLRILLVDDHDVVHWGLRIMLERFPWVECCHSAHGGEQALEIARANELDFALIDLFVGRESGPEICERLVRLKPELRVLLISGAGEISPAAAAACGASGFVSKDLRGRELVNAIRMVSRGMSLFDTRGAPRPGRAPDLTERERQVLELVATGATNREIAEQLSISPNTVKEYASTLYRKLDARNRAEAVQRARQLGLGR